MDIYQQFIAKSRYARWLEKENRRENWDETVNRYVNYIDKHLKEKCNFDLKNLKEKIRNSILNLEVMPSMRCLMSAGPALDRCNVVGYNCSYLPIDSPRSFDECMYILMCGCGVGFSVERQYINQLPDISEHFEKSQTVIIVEDSKSGWARALRELISLLYSGQIPKWDLSKLRPAGARLKTFGGRSSGPTPLDVLFQFCVNTFKKASGRKLNSLECHDIMCKIGEVVVVGGVRRSAMISLSNLSDERMRSAKMGDWYRDNVQRALSNNSVCYTEKPDVAIFMKEWLALYESKSGERGIFNRKAAKIQAAKSGRRNIDFDLGINPCSEIILRPFQFCNLSEVVVRSEDTEESLIEKVKIATILGTIQATFTEFKYLRKIWQKNCEEERLLGVSLTGILDNKSLLSDEIVLEKLKNVTIEVNKEYSKKFGINQATAITAVKPSGTVSQLVNSASGIHPRFSKYYIRTIRQDNNDPVTKFLKDAGIPWEADITKPENTTIFSFPVKAPENCVTREDISAIQHLKLWKKIQDFYCEHKPSITINLKEDDWFSAAAWVWENFDIISGISFLPFEEHIYKQAPYQKISEIEYNRMIETFPKEIDWNKLQEYEKEDTTTATQELACSSGNCEI